MSSQELLELLGFGTIKIDIQHIHTDTEEEQDVEEVVVEINSEENKMSEDPENDRDDGDNRSDYSGGAGAVIQSNTPSSPGGGSNCSSPSHSGGITDSDSGDDGPDDFHMTMRSKVEKVFISRTRT